MKYCLNLNVEHRSNGMFVHQSEYVENILKRFHMDITPISKSLLILSPIIYDVISFHKINICIPQFSNIEDCFKELLSGGASHQGEHIK